MGERGERATWAGAKYERDAGYVRAASIVDLWYVRRHHCHCPVPFSVFRFSCSCRGKSMGVWDFGLMLPVLVVEGCRACGALSVLDGRFNFWPNNAGVCGVLGARWNTRYEARCGIDRFRIRTVRAPGWTRYLWGNGIIWVAMGRGSRYSEK
jgi:hypothetical protein